MTTNTEMTKEDVINQLQKVRLKKSPTIIYGFVFGFITIYCLWNTVSLLVEKTKVSDSYFVFGQIFAILVCGIATLFWLYIYWQYKKSTPQPSPKLLPNYSLIEMAGICEERDLDAFILDLANTGYIQVLTEGKDIILFKKRDYDSEDKKGCLMKALFAEGNTLNINKISNNSKVYKFYKQIYQTMFGSKSMNDFMMYTLYKYFIVSTCYFSGGYYATLTYGGLGLWLYVVALSFVRTVYFRFKNLASWVITQSVLFGIMYALYGKELMDFIDNMIQLNFHSKILTLILGVLIIIFNLLPIQKIALGDKLSPELKSLREFIFNALQSNQRKVLEEEQILDKEYGYKILPYVHVIGVITVQEWLKQYDFLYKETPHWFTGEPKDLNYFFKLFKSQEGIFGWNMETTDN